VTTMRLFLLLLVLILPACSKQQAAHTALDVASCLVPGVVQTGLDVAQASLAAALQGGLPAINLAAHASLLTAFANDVNPDYVYAQQVLAFGKGGDVLLGIIEDLDALTPDILPQAEWLQSFSKPGSGTAHCWPEKCPGRAGATDGDA